MSQSPSQSEVVPIADIYAAAMQIDAEADATHRLLVEAHAALKTAFAAFDAQKALHKQQIEELDAIIAEKSIQLRAVLKQIEEAQKVGG